LLIISLIDHFIVSIEFMQVETVRVGTGITLEEVGAVFSGSDGGL
jgi:hypothetical protein